MPAASARLSLVASVHTPKYAPVARIRARGASITSASIDGGSARSAPSARPDSTQIDRRTRSRRPRRASAAHTNAAIAASIATQPRAHLADRARRAASTAACRPRPRRSTARGTSPCRASRLQHVGDEEEHERRRNRRGDAVRDEDRQQPAEQGVARAAPPCPRTAGRAVRPARARRGAREQRRPGRRRREPRRASAKRGRPASSPPSPPRIAGARLAITTPHEREALAHGGDARALDRVVRRARRPTRSWLIVARLNAT